MSQPRAEQMRLPSGYGEPTKLLQWDDVRRDLEKAQVYWIAWNTLFEDATRFIFD
ncbi:MAG TPA: hypothetical protein VE712_03615 [Actinomycetota bacterium]|jgi:hypothetical protein|nr:hypothetical protein [Actinomycetota bacterium]